MNIENYQPVSAILLAIYQFHYFSFLRSLSSKFRQITPMTLTKLLSALLVSLPFFVNLCIVLRNPPPERINGFADARIIGTLVPNDTKRGNVFDNFFTICFIVWLQRKMQGKYNNEFSTLIRNGYFSCMIGSLGIKICLF